MHQNLASSSPIAAPPAAQFDLPPEFRNRITLSIRECCDATGYGRTSFYAAIGRDELKVVRKGRRTLVPVSSLLERLAKPEGAELAEPDGLASEGKVATTPSEPRAKTHERAE